MPHVGLGSGPKQGSVTYQVRVWQEDDCEFPQSFYFKNFKMYVLKCVCAYGYMHVCAEARKGCQVPWSGSCGWELSDVGLGMNLGNC